MKKIVVFLFLTFTLPTNSQNDYWLGENYYTEGQYEKATQIFKNLYTKNPFNTNYLSRLISCYQETNRFSEAETLLKNNLQKHPSHGYLYVYLGYNYQRQQNQDLANYNYDVALNSIEKNPSYGQVIGTLFKEYSLLDQAVLAFEKTMNANPYVNYNFNIAQIYGEKGNYKQMFEAYINLVDKSTNYQNLVLRYTSKYITEDAQNEANILFKKSLLKKSASNPKDIWNVFLSWLFTQQKEYDKAFMQEKALYQRNANNLEAIFRLGKIAFENKNYTQAKECFSFVTLNSTSIEEKINAFLYLTKISIATNNPETDALFQQLLQQFGINNVTIPLQVAYADFLTFSQNKPNQAKEVLETAMQLSSNKYYKAKIKLKLADILVFTENYNTALLYFSQIQTQLKEHELAQEARFKVAQTSYFKGDFTWAKAQLKVLKGSTTQLIANDALQLYLVITDNEPVDSIPSGLLEYAKADVLAFQNKTQQAIDSLSFIVKNFKGQPIEDEAFFKQAELYCKLKDYESAIENFKKVVTLNPEGILADDAIYKLAELYNNHVKNYEKASEYYQKIIFEYPTSIYLVEARKKYRLLRGDTLN